MFVVKGERCMTITPAVIMVLLKSIVLQLSKMSCPTKTLLIVTQGKLWLRHNGSLKYAIYYTILSHNPPS